MYRPYKYTSDDWDVLLTSIKEQHCLPFLGAGACYGSIPLGGDVAQTLADEYKYPLSDRSNLIRVAQYIALIKTPSYVKDRLLKRWFSNLPDPSNDPPSEPHSVLAELPLPLYLTTNYDDFMTRALRTNHRNAHQELCRWNYLIENRLSRFDDSNLELHSANPIVFHLHGHAPKREATLQEKNQCANSLVLTEDDYLQLHVALNRPKVIPQPIKDALVSFSLLVIGYSMADTTFRALYRGLVGATELGIQNRGFIVMPPPSGLENDDTARVQQYLETYFGALNMRVYWSDARSFSKILLEKWRAFPQ